MRSMLSNNVLRLTAAAALLALGGCVAYPAGPGYYGAAPAPAPVAYADGGYYAVAPAPVVVAPPVVIPFGGYYGGYRGGWGGHGGYWHR